MTGPKKVSKRVYKICVNEEDFDFETASIKPKSAVEAFLEKIRARLIKQ